jgi:hypothetical protein
VDRNLVTDHAAHHVDLIEHPVDDLGAIAGADQQFLHSRTNQPAFYAQAWAALVLLGIDHVDPARGHGNVVNVGAAAR